MSFLKFIGSNCLYLAWFGFYFCIAWAVLGGDLNGFMLAGLIYGVSITVALSPVGEVILRALENCREPATEKERNYLINLFEEVYEDAKELNPKMSDNIKIYIMDAMYVNAFAMGRNTVAVTRGAMESFNRDGLKGIIAHELGHITHGHTKALLLTVIGNFFFTVMVWVLKLILAIAQFLSNILAQFNYIGIVFAFVTFVIRIFVNVFVFAFINLGQIALASNSRTNETQADTFAYEIGYGRELISSLYLLQRISMNVKPSLADKMKASHPHIAYRIKYLENLENAELEA